MSKLIQVAGIEEWRSIPNFEGYEVSSEGRVRSYRSKNGRGKPLDVPRILKAQNSPGKVYKRVGLSASSHGPTKYRPIHQLVLEAFIGARPTPVHEVCHRDGDGTNNHLSNLRWGSAQDNADDRNKHGTQVRGVQVNNVVLTEAQVKEIRAALPKWKKGFGRYFATKFGVGDSAISAVKHNQTWRHL